MVLMLKNPHAKCKEFFMNSTKKKVNQNEKYPKIVLERKPI